MRVRISGISFVVLILILVSLFASCNDSITEQDFQTPTIKGRVMVPEDSGVSPSDIFIQVGQTGNQYMASEDGSFVITGLEEDVPYTLYFSTEPFGNTVTRKVGDNGLHLGHYGGKKDDVYADKGSGGDAGIVTMKPLGALTGRVTLSGESEFTGIDVFIPGSSYMAKTDGSGAWTISNVPEGEYRVAFMHDGYSTHYETDIWLHIDEEKEENTVIVPDVVLVSDVGAISGSVIFRGFTGAELPIVTVTATDQNDATNGSTTTSNESGRYTIGNLSDGIYTLRFVPNDSRYQNTILKDIEVKSPAITDVPFVTIDSAGGTIEGSVTLTDGNVPQNVTVLAESEGYSYSIQTGEDGTFILSNVIPATYTISFMKEGYTTVKESVSVTTGESSSVNASLAAAYGYVLGKVFISGSDVHSGITVTASSINLDNAVSYTGVTGADGTFAIRIEKEAEYLVSASMSGYISSSPTIVNVSLGGSYKMDDVTLKRSSAVVSGKVTLEGAASHEGILLLLKNDTNSRTATTGQDGSFVFSSVVPGTYDLTISKDGYVSAVIEDIAVAPASEVVLDALTLKAGVRSVSGTVTLETLSDYAGVTITATSVADHGLIYSALSNSEGSFSLVGMKPGEYIITLSARGFGTVTLESVDITGEGEHVLDPVTLIVDKGRISGMARLEGYTDHSGILVELVGTSYSTETADDGSWELSVPSANYPGGIRYSCDDFDRVTIAETITVLTNGTFSVPDSELKAIAVPVAGRIDVAAADDDGVHVYLENTQFSVVTDKSGGFRFEHVPVGDYKLIAERENTPRAEHQFTVSASPVCDLGTIVMIPNSSNIIGHVYLEDMSYHAGIKVTVTTEGVDGELSAVTDSTGYYYIGNLISTGTHTVTFSKDGWDSQSTVVTGLEPLATREVEDFTLVDTTAPVLSSVTINDGANTSVSRIVTIGIDANDEGSGLDKMQVFFDTDFDTPVDYEDYYAVFERELEEGNGIKNVYIRVFDKAGNVSEIKSDSIELTDQKRTVGGVLKGDDLHWTKEEGPYFVESNILVEEGDTLTVDPGADVIFIGPYYIQVEGTLSARGTEAEPISMRGADAGEGKWLGIRGVSGVTYSGSEYDPVYQSGSILEYVLMLDPVEGISGNLFVTDSRITSEGEALSEFSGILKDSEVVGDVLLAPDSMIVNNSIETGSFTSKQYVYGSRFLAGNEIRAVDGDSIMWFRDYAEYVLENNLISGFKSISFNNHSSNSSVSYSLISNTIEDCGFLDTAFIMSSVPYILLGNDFDGTALRFLSTSENADGDVLANFNNLTDVTTGFQRENVAEHDFRFNFWGYTNTRELEASSEDANLSFIEDFYDDFDLTKVAYDGWLKDRNEYAGYKGDAYIAYTAEWDGEAYAKIDDGYSITPGWLHIDVECLNGKDIAEYRLVSCAEDIFSASWMPFGSSIDYSLSVEEVESILQSESVFVQLKDADGNCSGIRAIDLFSGIEGPAGGRIIYDNGSAGADGWRFIEMSPGQLKRIETDGETSFTFDEFGTWIAFGFYRLSSSGPNLFVNGTDVYSEYNCTLPDIGAGRRNTELLVENRKGHIYSRETGEYMMEYSIVEAIYQASINGYDDWYMPSIEEAMLFPAHIEFVMSSTEDSVSAFSSRSDGRCVATDKTVTVEPAYGIRYF